MCVDLFSKQTKINTRKQKDEWEVYQWWERKGDWRGHWKSNWKDYDRLIVYYKCHDEVHLEGDKLLNKIISFT